MPIVACPGCGAKNRVDERAQAMTPVCGRCGAELPAPAADSGHPVEVTDATFASEVLGSPTPVLLDCWAPWCGPCRMLTPTLDALAADAGGLYRVAKLNIDENPQTAAQFGIQSIPTLLLFKGGRLVDTLLGLQPRAAIESRLRAIL